METKNYHYYVVKQKGTDKYLRETVSRYGQNISLSDNIDIKDAIKFNSIMDCRNGMVGYIKGQKKLSINDLEIVHLYIETKETQLTSIELKEFNNIKPEYSCSGYGWIKINPADPNGDRIADESKITEESLKEVIYGDYRLKVKNIAYEMYNKEWSCAGKTKYTPYVRILSYELE